MSINLLRNQILSLLLQVYIHLLQNDEKDDRYLAGDADETTSLLLLLLFLLHCPSDLLLMLGGALRFSFFDHRKKNERTPNTLFFLRMKKDSLQEKEEEDGEKKKMMERKEREEEEAVRRLEMIGEKYLNEEDDDHQKRRLGEGEERTEMNEVEDAALAGDYFDDDFSSSSSDFAACDTSVLRRDTPSLNERQFLSEEGQENQQSRGREERRKCKEGEEQEASLSNTQISSLLLIYKIEEISSAFVH